MRIIFLKKKKKKNPVWHKGSVQLSKHSSNKTKELRVEASSAGKQGPLEGKPKKMISARTSWEGKGWGRRMHFLYCDMKSV